MSKLANPTRVTIAEELLKILTLKNRYPVEPFRGRFDGVAYTVEDTLLVPDVVAYHLRKQSIIQDNPITGENAYRLCIIEEEGDLPELVELPVESLDRTDMDMPKTKLISGTKTPMPVRKERFGSLEVGKK